MTANQSSTAAIDTGIETSIAQINITETPPSPEQNFIRSIARAIDSVPPWGWLLLCGTLMTVVYYMAFTRPYPFSEYADKANYTIALLGNFSADSAFLYIAAFLALFGLYYAGWQVARRLTRQLNNRAYWLLVIGFAIIFNAVLLPMYPADAADIYDYIIRGRMSTVYGLNPMVDTPVKVKDDPFYRFAAWHTVPSAYGAGWEMIAAVGSRIAGDDQQANVYVFKLINLIGYALAGLLVWLTLRIIAPRRVLSGFYLFTWNPLVLYMTAGTAHHDLLMAACMVLSIYCLHRRSYVASTLAAVLGTLIKFIPVLMIPFIALVAFRQLRGTARIRYFILSAVLGGLMCVLVYGPYWNGLSTLGIDRRTAMYTGSVATVARQELGYLFDGRTGETPQTPNTNNFLKWVVLGVFGVFYLSQLERLYTAKLDRVLKDDPLFVTRLVITVLLFYLTVACAWFQSWYVLWVIPLVALLDNTPLQRTVLLFSYLVTWQSFLYNFVTLRIGTNQPFAPIPWRDLIPVAVVQLPIWGYVLYYWIATWWRQTHRDPLAILIGQRLSAARGNVQLIPSEVSDRMVLCTDDLLAYERGERSIPLNRLDNLARELGLSVTALLGNEVDLVREPEMVQFGKDAQVE